MKATISRWGNSLALRIPKVAAEAAGLREGDVVDVAEDGGALRVTRSKRIDIEAMIAGLDPATFHNDDPWMTVRPVGEEIR